MDRVIAIPYHRINRVEVKIDLECPGLITNRAKVRITPSALERSIGDITLFTSGAKEVIVTSGNVSYTYELQSDEAFQEYLVPIRQMSYIKVNQNI